VAYLRVGLEVNHLEEEEDLLVVQAFQQAGEACQEEEQVVGSLEVEAFHLEVVVDFQEVEVVLVGLVLVEEAFPMVEGAYLEVQEVSYLVEVVCLVLVEEVYLDQVDEEYLTQVEEEYLEVVEFLNLVAVVSPFLEEVEEV
jgi:hypothetical protein